jgi:hypothetical protein
LVRRITSGEARAGLLTRLQGRPRPDWIIVVFNFKQTTGLTAARRLLYTRNGLERSRSIRIPASSDAPPLAQTCPHHYPDDQ